MLRNRRRPEIDPDSKSKLDLEAKALIATTAIELKQQQKRERRAIKMSGYVLRNIEKGVFDMKAKTSRFDAVARVDKETFALVEEKLAPEEVIVETYYCPSYDNEHDRIAVRQVGSTAIQANRHPMNQAISGIIEELRPSLSEQPQANEG